MNTEQHIYRCDCGITLIAGSDTLLAWGRKYHVCKEPTMTTQQNDEMEKAFNQEFSQRCLGQLRVDPKMETYLLSEGFRAGWSARGESRPLITDSWGNGVNEPKSSTVAENAKEREKLTDTALGISRECDTTERLNALRSILSLFNDMATVSNEPEFIKARSGVIKSIADLVGGAK